MYHVFEKETSLRPLVHGHYVFIDQDGWILANFFIYVFMTPVMNQEGVEVHKHAKVENKTRPIPSHLGQQMFSYVEKDHYFLAILMQLCPHWTQQ